MLQGLADRLDDIFKRLRGYGRLTEENIAESLREVRLALLEADVNVKVVRSFLERVRERAVGKDVLGSLSPGQQVVKVVFEELTELMGGTASRLKTANQPPTRFEPSPTEWHPMQPRVSKLSLPFTGSPGA